MVIVINVFSGPFVAWFGLIRPKIKGPGRIEGKSIQIIKITDPTPRCLGCSVSPPGSIPFGWPYHLGIAHRSQGPALLRATGNKPLQGALAGGRIVLSDGDGDGFLN